MNKTASLRPFILVILFAQLLWSCGQNSQNSKATSPENISAEEVQLLIDTFSTFPPEIDGCACYFSNNETEFINNIYIYADDYQDHAFVSINGAMTKFELSTSDISEDRSVETFLNDEYTITVDVKQVGQLDETWQKAGTLTIKPKDRQEIIKKIYGECGC